MNSAIEIILKRIGQHLGNSYSAFGQYIYPHPWYIKISRIFQYVRYMKRHSKISMFWRVKNYFTDCVYIIPRMLYMRYVNGSWSYVTVCDRSWQGKSSGRKAKEDILLPLILKSWETGYSNFIDLHNLLSILLHEIMALHTNAHTHTHTRTYTPW